MGSIVEYKDKWRAVVRIKGQTRTKVFAKHTAAETWVSETEVGLRARKVFAHGHTLGTILDRYRVELDAATFKKSYTVQIKRFAVDYADVDVADLTADWWVDTVSGWDVKPQTRAVYLGQFRGALVKCADWGIKVDWASLQEALVKLRRNKVIKAGKPRSRRVTPAEVAAIKAAARACSRLPMADLIDFAIATCMRRAEICRLTWTDLDDSAGAPMIWIRDRKHPTDKAGNHKHIPLLGESLAIIQRQPRDSKFIFPIKPMSISKAFLRACSDADIDGIHFHDLRHEGISRMFDGSFQIEEVALVSGHESWEMLKRYTHIAPQRLHQGPISRGGVQSNPTPPAPRRLRLVK
jgi:integrase